MVSRGSCDLNDGWDFNVREQRLQAEETVRCVDPDLLTMCPPCGPLSRMQNLTPDSQRVDITQHQKNVGWWCGAFEVPRDKYNRVETT